MEPSGRHPQRKPRFTGVLDLVDTLRNFGLIRIGLLDRERLDSFVADDGQTIPVSVGGAGVPVVLIHGLGCSHKHWRGVTRRLSSQNRVFAWDARGHGKCRVEASASVTLTRLARDLANLLDHFGIERAVLVGHSMGALTLMQYLQDYGAGKVLALAIVDQSPRIVTDEQWRLGLFGSCSASMLSGLIESARRSLAETVLREIENATGEWAQRFLLPDARLGRWLRSWFERTDLGPLLDLAASLAAADFRAVCARLSVPLLVVLGGRSPHYAGVALDRYYQETVPHARVRIYARAGHSPHYAEPTRFARDLGEFISVVARYSPEATGTIVTPVPSTPRGDPAG